jgi:Reeler domain
MKFGIIALAFSITAGAILIAVPLLAYTAGPPPGSTGGFGEPTCTRCHNSYQLNAGKAAKLGDLIISGIPKQYQPGKMYAVKVELTHMQDRMYWGFQLAARVKDTGAQAGDLKKMDGNTQVLPDKGIQYIEHTSEGIFNNIFEFAWVAPASAVGDVIINAAGNAANGSGDPSGDYIYSVSVTVPPISK